MVRGVKIEIDTFDDELEKTMTSKMKVKPLDKRSDLINRKIAPKHQLLCYICCAEYGPSSLEIHQKTCRKKHGWAMEANVLNEQGVPKKKAEANLKKCCPPGDGPWCDVPTAKSSIDDVHEYNDEALGLFFEHAEICLLCRTKNSSAQQAAQHALGKTVSRRKKLGLDTIKHTHSSADLLKEKDSLMQTTSVKKSVKSSKSKPAGDQKEVQFDTGGDNDEGILLAEKAEKESWLRQHEKQQQERREAEEALRLRLAEEIDEEEAQWQKELESLAQQRIEMAAMRHAMEEQLREEAQIMFEQEEADAKARWQAEEEMAAEMRENELANRRKEAEQRRQFAERARRQQEEEEEAQWRADEEAAAQRRKKMEEKRLAEQESRRKKEEEAQKLQFEEEEARIRADDEAARRRHQEAAARREEADAAKRLLEDDAKAEEEEAERLRKLTELAAQRRAEAETRRREAQDAWEAAQVRELQQQQQREREEELQRQQRAEERKRAIEEARKRDEAEAEARWKREMELDAERRAEAIAQRQADEARLRQAEQVRRAEEEAARRAARNRAMAEEEEQFRQRAEQAIEQRKIRVGKHEFLKKREGHLAASEASKVQLEKEINEKARKDIVYYSILHAKKEGLIQNAPPISEEEVEDFGYQTLSESLQGKWHQQWSTVDEKAFCK